jgi:hypothetical protein
MAGVIEDVGAGVVAHAVQKHLEGHAIVQILAGVEFEADVDAIVLIDVQNRLPPAGQFVEGILHQPSRTLGPGIDIGPRQRA